MNSKTRLERMMGELAEKPIPEWEEAPTRITVVVQHLCRRGGQVDGDQGRGELGVLPSVEGL